MFALHVLVPTRELPKVYPCGDACWLRPIHVHAFVSRMLSVSIGLLGSYVSLLLVKVSLTPLSRARTLHVRGPFQSMDVAGKNGKPMEHLVRNVAERNLQITFWICVEAQNRWSSGFAFFGAKRYRCRRIPGKLLCCGILRIRSTKYITLLLSVPLVLIAVSRCLLCSCAARCLFLLFHPPKKKQVSVVPFLSLGIGIDDMFIFIYTLVSDRSVRRQAAHQSVNREVFPSRVQPFLGFCGCSVAGWSAAFYGHHKGKHRCWLIHSARD